jgi:signal transduction histidine kinase
MKDINTTDVKNRNTHRPKLQTILFWVNFIIILLPLGGIYFLKLFDNELIHQTESELVSQAAVIGASYKHEVQKILEKNTSSSSSKRHYGVSCPNQNEAKTYFHPVPPRLDLSKDQVLPPRPDGEKPMTPPDDIALDAGKEMLPIIKESQQVTLSGIKILDYQGIVVSGRQEMQESFAHLEEFKAAIQGKPISLLRKRIVGKTPPPLESISRGARLNVCVALPILMDHQVIGVVLMIRTPMDSMKSLYSKRIEIMTALVLLFLVILGISALTSFTITRPILNLIQQAEGITQGDPITSAPLKHPVTHEIAILSESFSAMAKELNARSVYIQNFATQVSHEFKTPLTSIKGAIELLQEHIDSMPVEQRNRFLNNVLEDTNRLSQLVTKLLELARADVLEPIDESSDVAQLLMDFIPKFKDQYAHETARSVQFTLLGVEAPLKVVIPSEILETVFQNLFDNCYQQLATEIHIEFIVEAANQHVRILIEDNGPGVSSANQSKLFEPFFTTHRQTGGTGLGLNIVRSLLSSQNAAIDILSDEDLRASNLERRFKGALFQLKLPLLDV